jgi:hypothetical protein
MLNFATSLAANLEASAYTDAGKAFSLRYNRGLRRPTQASKPSSHRVSSMPTTTALFIFLFVLISGKLQKPILGVAYTSETFRSCFGSQEPAMRFEELCIPGARPERRRFTNILLPKHLHWRIQAQPCRWLQRPCS